MVEDYEHASVCSGLNRDSAVEREMDKTLRFVKPEDYEDSLGVLRSHGSKDTAIRLVVNISKEKSKAIAKRTRDAIVAAYKEDRL